MRMCNGDSDSRALQHWIHITVWFGLSETTELNAQFCTAFSGSFRIDLSR
jgi:hypothetical protein